MHNKHAHRVSPDQTSYDIELVRRLKRGDIKAQYTVYEKYVDAMYHTAIRIVNNPIDAQDVVQECFIKVFDKIGSFREESTLGAWIKRIAINTSYNVLRQKQRRPEFFTDEFSHVETAVTDDLEEGLFTPAQLHQAVKTLPDGCRTVLSLYALEGYSHKEIGDIMTISESTSKTQYRRAKRLLLEKLQSTSET